MRVLIIEDEEKTADYLHRGLTEQGYTVDVARDGIDGLHLAMESDYAVIVLDVMLPGLAGFGVLRALRALLVRTIESGEPAASPLVAAIVAEARDGDRILVMSNGGFGGIHGKLLAALAG